MHDTPPAQAGATTPAELPAGFVPVPRGTEPRDGNFAIIAGPDGREYMGPRKSIGLDPRTAPPVPPAKAGGAGEPLVDLGKMVRQSALPVIGGTLGGAAGSLLPVPGAGTLIGMGVGSAGGEWLNQALGITEPSMLAIGASGLLPAIPATARKAALSVLPGVEAGLHQLTRRKALEAAARVGSTASPSALYDEALGLGAAVPKGPIGAATADVVAREAAIAPDARLGAVKKVVGTAQSLLDLKGSDPTTIPLEILLPNLQRLGAIYRSAAKKGGAALPEIAEVYGGLQTALDRAAASGTGPGVAVLRTANEQFKRGLAEAELTALANKAVSHTAGHPGFNADHVLDALKPGSKTLERVSKWLPDAEIDAFREAVRNFAKIAPISPAGKTGVGGTGFAQRALVGGLVGGVAGGPIGAVGGILATEALTRTLMTRPGQAAVKAMAAEKLGGWGATFDQVVNGLLQATAAAQREAPAAPLRVNTRPGMPLLK